MILSVRCIEEHSGNRRPTPAMISAIASVGRQRGIPRSLSRLPGCYDSGHYGTSEYVQSPGLSAFLNAHQNSEQAVQPDPPSPSTSFLSSKSFHGGPVMWSVMRTESHRCTNDDPCELPHPLPCIRIACNVANPRWLRRLNANRLHP